ncbi:MAG: hypothetical protein AAGF67_13365 [Verrucomicrobiota bacterium]
MRRSEGMKIWVTVFLFVSVSAQAHNNLFFPGDAFFSARADAELLRQLTEGEDPQLLYARYSRSWMLCGYAGFWNARIDGLPDVTRDNLRSTLRTLFEKELGKARKRETEDGIERYFPVLIYNRNFDFSEYPVGLKFNENFESDQIEDAKRKHAVDDRVRSKQLRKFDESHAESVGALDAVRISGDLTAPMGVKEPVVIDGSGIVFVILLGGEKEDLLDHANRKSGLERIVVGETVSRITYK